MMRAFRDILIGIFCIATCFLFGIFAISMIFRFAHEPLMQGSFGFLIVFALLMSAGLLAYFRNVILNFLFPPKLDSEDNN